MTRFPEQIACPRCLLVAPAIDLSQALQQALNQSYALHARFMDWPRPERSLVDVEQGLRAATDAFHSQEGEKRYYLVSPRREQVLGCVGVELGADPLHYLLGYWASANHTRQGYMSEALRQLLPLLSHYPVRLTTSSANLASQRLALRSGFRQIAVVPNDRHDPQLGWHDTLVYEITRYQQAQGVPLRPNA
ncbi:GNAT family N-acetyltransferase [Pseudomonas sp. 21LCFQ02]|uniref:GNAT family N-acetyltransferase n=1 Tax=Pseudomonas sp. 21LCFQ02 TaxID=2957505 RepID=UPI00209AD050|nr:GNAT family protein [Pseudomonas sp. 21LCFQ02]MCO8170204.1 GNAT family N-acetyltransferase [Pseudomonas sp. 21LCFQ02]